MLSSKSIILDTQKVPAWEIVLSKRTGTFGVFVFFVNFVSDERMQWLDHRFYIVACKNNNKTAVSFSYIIGLICLIFAGGNADNNRLKKPSSSLRNST